MQFIPEHISIDGLLCIENHAVLYPLAFAIKQPGQKQLRATASRHEALSLNETNLESEVFDFRKFDKEMKAPVKLAMHRFIRQAPEWHRTQHPHLA